MKKILIVILLLISAIQGFSQAKDTLNFDNKTVWYSTPTRHAVNRMIYANFLSKYDSQTGRISIIVNGATFYEGILADLYIAGANTITDKVSFLENKITSSSTSQIIATLATKMNANGTDTNIPPLFRSGAVSFDYSVFR